MTKTFTSLSTIAFSCLLCLQAVKGFALDKDVTDTSGVYIKGTIGVFGNDTFGMFGNVYLDHAKQVGDGQMAMVDTQAQLLVAEQSSINNLLIHNPTTVTLIGELIVLHSLTIDTGTFDTRKGTLTLLPNTTLTIRSDGTLLRHTPISIGYQHNTSFYFLKAVVTNSDLGEPFCMQYTEKNKIEATSLYKFNYSKVLRPPPEQYTTIIHT